MDVGTIELYQYRDLFGRLQDPRETGERSIWPVHESCTVSRTIVCTRKAGLQRSVAVKTALNGRFNQDCITYSSATELKLRAEFSVRLSTTRRGLPASFGSVRLSPSELREIKSLGVSGNVYAAGESSALKSIFHSFESALDIFRLLTSSRYLFHVITTLPNGRSKSNKPELKGL